MIGGILSLIRGYHQYDSQFTQIRNAALRDARISLAARALYSQLLSHAPGWKVSQENLAFANGIGRDAIRTLINELVDAGYLEKSEERERNDKGYLGGYTYTTKDPWAKPTLDEPTQDEPLHKNTNTKNNNLKNNKITYESFEEFWEIYPKKLDKGAARRAWTTAIKKVSAELIIEKAKAYADDPNLPEKRYIKYPASWLNAEAWANGPLPNRGNTSKQDKTKKAIEEWLNGKD